MSFPRVGAEVSGYRLESVIARGGMSTVFLAEHLRLGRRVAMKILASDLSEDDTFRERFVRESRIAAGLDHPNVIPIYEAGELDGLLFLAMRYVQGPQLKRLIEEQGPLAPERAVSITSQVAGALDAAHARGLVHRDVKPGNILLDVGIGPEHTDHVYLCDFGLTKQTTSHSGLTRTGQFVGTIDYISPEQIEGKDVDARTDVYSLGCVLYEELTGVVPFEKNTEAAVLWAHVQEEPTPVSERRPDLPATIDDVVNQAMAKSPDDRYQTCEELANGLRGSLAGSTAAAPSSEVRAREEPVEPMATVATQTQLAAGDEGQRSPKLETTASSADATPRGRRRAVSLAAAGIGAIGIAVVFGVIGYLAAGGNPGGTTSSQAMDMGDHPPCPSNVGTADSVQCHLWTAIPQNVAIGCRTIPQPDTQVAGATSAIRCSPGNGISQVTYYDIASKVQMQDYFTQRVMAVEASAPEAFGATCATDRYAQQAWRAQDPTAESVVHEPGASSTGIGGQVICYLNPSAHAVIEWTDGDLSIYAIAVRSDAQQGDFFRWWTTEAGPFNPHLHEHGSSGSSPSGGMSGEPMASDSPSM